MSLTKSECHKKHSVDESHLSAHCKRSPDSKVRSTQSGQPSAKRVRAQGRKVRSTRKMPDPVKGTRSLLDPRRQQHEQISQMHVRIQQLENGLAELQKKCSSEPHPLLVAHSPLAEGSAVRATTSTRSVSHDSESMSGTGSCVSDNEGDLLAEALGAMSIHNDGTAEFHGSTATSEYLLKFYHQKVHNENLNVFVNHQIYRFHNYPDIFLRNVQFPCTPAGQAPPDMTRFQDFLPSYERARILLHNYFSCFSWLAMPIPNDELENIFTAIYSPYMRARGSVVVSDAHRLAVLFMVFLFGTLFDLEMDCITSSIEAEDYHILARAAVASDPVTENTTVNGVRAFILMIWYFRLVPGRRSPSYQWGLSGYLLRLVQAIGLHRDSRDKSSYIQDPASCRRFEQTFWEYNAMDIWQCYMFGRPTSMTSNMVLCKTPPEVDVYQGLDPQYYIWKYSFARLASKVITVTSAESVTYDDICGCEKEIQQHWTPLGLEWPPNNSTDEIAGKAFQRCITVVWKQVAMMYIHRPYFWEAVSKYPDEPTKSIYWRSVGMAHNSAITLVSAMRRLWLIHPKLIERMAPFWSHAQSAALVLGALVFQSPGCSFASEALQHFEETCNMFSLAKNGFQPENAIEDMQKLLAKARLRFRGEADQIILDSDLSAFSFSLGEPQPLVLSEHTASAHMISPVSNDYVRQTASRSPSDGSLSEVFAHFSQQQGNGWGWFAPSENGMHYHL